jgi:hypothetical protein
MPAAPVVVRIFDEWIDGAGLTRAMPMVALAEC